MQCSTYPDGRCQQRCSADGDCQNGVRCVGGACVAGCRADQECALGEACINSQCGNPCSISDCGSNAECEVSNHKPVCLCRRGYQRQGRLCRKAQCSSDAQCNRDKQVRSSDRTLTSQPFEYAFEVAEEVGFN